MKKHLPRTGGTRSSVGGRAYRKVSARPGEFCFQVVVEESDLWITVGESDVNAGALRDIALRAVMDARAAVRAWMLLQPVFAASLAPVAVPDHAPEIIRHMAAAAAVMDVGPMATVAAAVADWAARSLLPYTADCIVENGGDSVLYSTRDRVVALLPDPVAGASLGLVLHADAFPLSLCASSATIGHSLSFGKGELAVVRSKDPFLADAAATALCNRLLEPEDAGRVAEYASTFGASGIDGVFLQCGNAIGVWGAMELTAL